ADLGRARKLLGQGYETPQRQEQAVSEVAVLEAAVQADHAAIDAARLAIEHASVRAPIAGRLGAATLREGNLARPNDAQPLVTITQMSPVLVAFTLPERELAAVMARQTDEPLPVRVRPQGGEADVDCRLAFIDSAIDAATGTILMKARCDNHQRRLWPGQFVTAEVTVAVEEALVVPETAVQLRQQGGFVFVARPDGTATVRPVRVARRSKGLAVIAEGLAAGDRVVVDGHSRLAEGARFGERRP
ncbi:MAG: efflux RND transporter periplasmic adaptor subunit, partial [Alphaproteobacteria bacterium]|nr:efflux RND transporter periplasmic adaptor subunit [Alphaproteobacteria bacterium]